MPSSRPVPLIARSGASVVLVAVVRVGGLHREPAADAVLERGDLRQPRVLFTESSNSPRARTRFSALVVVSLLIRSEPMCPPMQPSYRAGVRSSPVGMRFGSCGVQPAADRFGDRGRSVARGSQPRPGRLLPPAAVGSRRADPLPRRCRERDVRSASKDLRRAASSSPFGDAQTAGRSSSNARAVACSTSLGCKRGPCRMISATCRWVTT
jgi:hypothetical protein